MLGAILGGAQVLGGIAGFMSGRKEQKWGKRQAAAAQAQADEVGVQMQGTFDSMQGERDFSISQRDAAIARGENLDFAGNDQALAAQIKAGEDLNTVGNTAADQFTNQYDVSLDAQKRAMAAQGVRPGSSAMAALGEDAAYDRARGAATQSNEARRQADDQNFARKLAFSDMGQQNSNSILGQSANIMNQYQGEYGAQGQIRGQHLAEAGVQAARANAGQQAMLGAAGAVGQGALQYVAGGGPGVSQGMQGSALNYISANKGV